jgi:hypothetical protein
MAHPTRRERPDALPLQTRLAPIASVAAEARTVELVWTTGAAVRRRRWTGWDTPVDYEEILVVSRDAVDLSRLANGAPVLDSHAQWTTRAVVGVVERAWIDGGEGRATVRFPKPGVDEAADRLFALVADGIVRNVSVGYRIDKVRVEKPERVGEIERWFVERWTPHELSFVAIGADPGAQVRAEPDEPTFPIQFLLPEETRTMDETVRTEPAGAPENEPANPPSGEQRSNPAPSPQASTPDPDAVRAEERERVRTIFALQAQFGLERAFADDLVARGVSVADARSAVLDKLAERDAQGAGLTQVSFPAGGLDATVTRREALAEALLHRVAPAAFAMTDRAREFRGMSLIDVARNCLEVIGVRVRGMTANEIAYAATRGAGLHSTSDFPLILAAVAGKRLRQAYQSTPRTFERWTRGITATDFKPMYPTQIGNFPALKPVLEGAEFSYGTIAEGRETYKLGTFGRIVGLTRQAIINDDLRAFDRALATAGQRAGDLESTLVYGELLANAALADGVALFHATHGNVGAASVIDEGALSEAWELMAQHKDLSGEEYVVTTPRFILVPPGARSIEARKMVAQVIAGKTQDVNAFAGSLDVIEEPRLFKAGGPQPWWLAADPNLVDTIEYARLEGQTEPFLDQRVGFEVDGVEIKVRHDFAAKALDYRGLFFNAGANPA